MNTLDMMIEARENGKTYYANKHENGLAYNNKLGFHDADDETPWDGYAFKFLNQLMDEVDGWHISAVDWNKVPIDTKIMVRFEIGGKEYAKHFAGVDGSTIFFWINGQTSFTTDRKASAEIARIVK